VSEDEEPCSLRWRVAVLVDVPDALGIALCKLQRGQKARMPFKEDPALARVAAKLSASVRQGASSRGLAELLRARFPDAILVRYVTTVTPVPPLPCSGMFPRTATITQERWGS
jgi:hypothetical protein